MPITLKSLTGTQLDELERELDTWIKHYRARLPAPVAVSTPSPTADVQVPSMSPPVQHSTGPTPVLVSAPATDTWEYVSTHAAPVTLPASPDFGGGSSRIRLPALPYNNGNADSSKPEVILALLDKCNLRCSKTNAQTQ